MRCKPITLSEVVGGQMYINVSVDICGVMGISYPILCGQPFRKPHYGLFIRTQNGRERSTSDMGLNPNNRYNDHRIFRFNLTNQRILESLVAQQDLRGYITLISINSTSAAPDWFDEGDWDYLSGDWNLPDLG